ncbi:sodium-dependent noradrenaline transporter-like isoform X2 [Amblyomma americanum]
MPVARQRFESETDCLLCCLNYCLGLSNVAVFPFLIYDNGGVVFLLVYLILLCAVAVPMLYLEIFLGQFCGWSVPRAFGGFPMAKGVGWTMVYSEVLVVLFHIPVLAYCLSYVMACFRKELPWNTCGYHGVEEHGCYRVKHGSYPCFKINETLARRYSSHNYSGGPVIVVSGAEGLERVSVPLQEYEALRNNCINGTISAARAYYERHVATSGYAADDVGGAGVNLALAVTIGWVLILTAILMGLPSLRKTWSAASQHMFYTIGLSVGTVTFFASHNNFDWPILGTAVKITVADTLLGLFAAFVVFALYGHLADEFAVEIVDLTTPGLDYMFVSFPETVEPLPWPRVWSLAYFLMVSITTLGPQICTFASAVGSLADMNLALSERRTLWACLSCMVGYAVSLPIALQGVGITFRNFVGQIIYFDLLPWIGVAEVITVAYAYGASRFTNDIYFIFKEHPPAFLPLCWRFVCPVMIGVTGLTSLVNRAQKSHDSVIGFQWTNPLEMCVFVSVVVLIGAFVLHALAQNKYDLYAAMEPQPGYGPKDEELYSKYIAFLAERNALPSIKGQLVAKLTPTRPLREVTKADDTASIQSPAASASPVAVAEPALFTERRRSSELGMSPEGTRGSPAVPGPTTPMNMEPGVAAEDGLQGATAPTWATTTGAEPTTAATISEAKQSSSMEHSEPLEKASG